MNFYCVDTDVREGGFHEVHQVRCTYIPEDKIDLGPYPSCYEAVRAARKFYKLIRGCRYCCMECYTYS
ncbi:hypothetical protein SAMN05660236_5009 [Ohtaekwangia koreensis]|uniref:Uncharacterized protein n=1 Tax=Ohtaekwangia koreensis TaxID=688867 RepID=A0A1T5MCJ3_9BACT|nr:hypothetical protein SAMN05660236_5009 [Ohtaekwangia koreensis]